MMLSRLFTQYLECLDAFNFVSFVQIYTELINTDQII